MKYIYDTNSKRIIGIELNTLYTYYSNYGNVIINGDLNVVL